MNTLTSLYCNQYYQLKKNGEDTSSARLRGTVMVSVCLIFNLLTILLLLFFAKKGSLDGLGSEVMDLIEDLPNKLVVAIPFAVILLLVRFTLGTEKFYNKTIAKFEALPPKKQKSVSRMGDIYFIFSLVAVFGFVMAFVTK